MSASHRAINIAAPVGTLVVAADRGIVYRSGWNAQGYAYFVIIDHNIDYNYALCSLERSVGGRGTDSRSG